MKKYIPLISTILLFSLFFLGCQQTVKPSDDYKYYKQYLTENGIGIEFYGKGYGTYGQLLPEYCEGSISSIFDPDKTITISSSTHDNSSATVNEAYVILTLNRNVNTLTTSFDYSPVRTNIISCQISYIDENNKEVSISNSLNKNKIYPVNKYVKTLKLTIRQQKYFSSTSQKYKDQIKNELTYNKFTIKQFLPE